MSISDADQKAIENFATSEDLVHLETRFARFNIFEALSVERRELSHSSFLAFLLDPYRGHGLRDLFLRRFLQEAVRTSEKPTEITAIDIHLMDLTQSEVKREQGNIDLLIKDHLNRLIVVIENKVDTEQHSNQLTRYREQTQKNYPGYRWIGILLSLEGERPDDQLYIPFTYVQVRTLVLEILRRDALLIGPAVKASLQQYADLLGRRFMADTELKELCARIYKRHKQAIDILLANIPDDREELASSIQELISAAAFELNSWSTAYIGFSPPDADLPSFKGAGSASSGRLLLFGFVLNKDSISLLLYMGPGDEIKRAAIHALARQNQPPFKVERKLSTNWQQLYSKSILKSSDYEQEFGDRVKTVQTKWKEFIAQDLPSLREKLLTLDWTAATPTSV